MSEKEASQHTLPELMLELQAEAIRISKDAEADTGKYKYKYLTLEKLLEEVLPKLNALGLVWVTRPIIHSDGQPALHYQLMRASKEGGQVGNEAIEGIMPLMLRSGGTPQDMGSALSYARRYALLTVLNIAPDEDSDGAISTAQRGSRSQQGVRKITEARAKELYAGAVAAGQGDRLQLAASHAFGSDVGSCRTEKDAAKALRKLSVDQGKKVSEWIAKKTREALDE